MADYKIRIMQIAQDDMKAIVMHIRINDPDAAIRMYEKIKASWLSSTCAMLQRRTSSIMREMWSWHWYQDVTTQIHTEDSWKCFLMTPRVRPFWYGCAGLKDLICPACKTSAIPWNESRRRLACPICRHQTSLSAGTIFDKTRTPLTTWFEAAWHMTTAKNGMSAKTLGRTLGTSYRVAWTMLQRFRLA